MDFSSTPKQIASVIRIIDECTLIINAGKSVINNNNYIQVYQVGEEIKDLDGKSLGYFIFIKDKLKITQVEDNFSICQKQEAVTRPALFALAPILEETYNERVPLKVDTKDIQPFDKIDPTIHIGDAVRFA